MSSTSAVDKPIGRRFIFSLALAVFGTSMLDVLSSLFLVDLAKTFLGSSDNTFSNCKPNYDNFKHGSY